MAGIMPRPIPSSALGKLTFLFPDFHALTHIDFSTLTGIPIAGEIYARCNDKYWGLIVFVTACYAAGLICITAAKMIHVGWRRPWAIY